MNNSLKRVKYWWTKNDFNFDLIIILAIFFAIIVSSACKRKPQTNGVEVEDTYEVMTGIVVEVKFPDNNTMVRFDDGRVKLFSNIEYDVIWELGKKHKIRITEGHFISAVMVDDGVVDGSSLGNQSPEADKKPSL